MHTTPIAKARVAARSRRWSSSAPVLGWLLVGLAGCVDDRPVGVLMTEMRPEQALTGGSGGSPALPLAAGAGSTAAPMTSPAPAAPAGSNGVTQVMMLPPPPAGSTAPPAVNVDGLSLDRLDPTRTGVAIEGATCNVARAGDINRDGRSDLLASGPGAAYALFRPQQLIPARLADIPERLPGIVLELNGDDSCSTIDVAPAGDVNGDGFADFIVDSAYRQYPEGLGTVFVVFGGAEPRRVSAAQLESGTSDGFMVRGADGLRAAADAAGDLNGDGLDDIVLSGSQGTFVVFGKRDFANVRLYGEGDGPFAVAYMPAADALNSLRGGVANLGDLNGDGKADLAAGAEADTVGGNSFAGRVYVSWGNPLLADRVSVDPASSFVINGAQADDRTGTIIGAAGDVNGDGIPDILIEGPARMGADGSRTGALAYVVWGKTNSAPVDLADIDAGRGGGFAIQRRPGPAASEQSDANTMVSAAGDLNGDGLDDLLIDSFNPGRVYVVFGRREESPIAAADLNPPSSLGLTLLNPGGLSADGAGDVNGDGQGDLVLAGNAGLLVVYGSGVALAGAMQE